MFFEAENNLKVLEDILNKYWGADERCKFKIDFGISDDNFILFIDSLSIIREIYNHPKTWDSLSLLQAQNSTELLSICKYFNDLEGSTERGLQNPIETMYLYSLRLFYEVDFRINDEPAHSTLFNEHLLDQIKTNIANNSKNESYSSNFRKKLNKIIFSVPYDILKYLYNSEEIKLFSEFDEKKKAASQTLEEIKEYSDNLNEQISKLDKKLEIRQTKVERLEDTLKNQQSHLNFAGLSEGFHNLLKQKEKEAYSLFVGLIVMGLVMIAPLICTIFSLLPETILQEKNALNHMLKLVPFISLEVILIYFFRVILQNYKSVKAQILQIELRRTLCQFIESYTDYSKDVKGDKESNPLEKFENLIFSGIISDAENLPSTFDGMDQIGKLLSSLKSK